MVGYCLRFVLFAFLFLILVEKGWSLKCYTCLEASGGTCRYSIPMKCDHMEVCGKRTSDPMIFIPPVVIKDCVPRDFCSGQNPNDQGHCSICEEDFCNSSAIVIPSFILTGLLLLKDVLL